MRKLILIPLFSLFTLMSIAFGIEFVIVGSAREIYDDNILASSKDEDGDFITELMAGFGIRHEDKKQNLYFVGHVYQHLYFEHHDLHNNFQDLELIYTTRFTNRNRFTLHNLFQHYPEPRSYDYLFGRTLTRGRYLVNSLMVGLLTDITSSLKLDTHYTNVINEIENETLVDSSLHKTGFRVDYVMFPSVIVSPFYDYTYISFDTGDANKEHRPGLGLRLNFTKKFFTIMRSGVGYSTISDGNTYRNEFYSVSASHIVNERNNLKLSYSKESAISTNNEQVFNNWRVVGEFNRQMLERLSFSLSSFYGIGDYSPTDIEVKLIGASTTFRYELTQNIISSVSYNFSKNETIVPGMERAAYTRNQISVMVRAEL